MDTSSLFDSSLEDELILNVQRPSLVSLSSDDSGSLSFDTFQLMENKRNAVYMPAFQSSTPYVRELASPSKETKRYSLTVYREDPSLLKSASMYDISAIPSNLHKDQMTFSTETLQSNSAFTTKSKDSGFQRSTSCTSITTSNGFVKRYDHVPSKVKQYIQNIKQQEALNKMKKQLSKESAHMESPDSSPASDKIPVSKKQLLNKVKELEEEIKEKDDVIELLAKDHTQLKLKYAAAENKIDDLRIKISCSNKPVIENPKIPEIGFSDGISDMCSLGSKVSKAGLSDGISGMYSLGSKVSKVGIKSETGSADSVNTDCTKNFISISKRPTSTPMYPSSAIIKSSSCKYVNNPEKHKVQKSASNIENGRKAKETDFNLPSDVVDVVNKVHRWQESLKNAEVKTRSPKMVTYNIPKEQFDDTDTRVRTSSGGYELKPSKKSKSKSVRIAECNCNISNHSVLQKGAKSHRKLGRSMSFASYEDSVASSMYGDDSDDTDQSSSGCSSVMFVPRQQRYRDFKQRVEFKKKEPEILKAHSVGNIRRCMYAPDARSEYPKVKPRSRQLKWEEEKKPSPVVKCKTVDFCEKKVVCKTQWCGAHWDQNDDRNHRSKNGQYTHTPSGKHCSCLLPLEKLKVHEKETLNKFAEHVRKHPRRHYERIQETSKRHSAYK